jgi:transmembrane sensor
MKSNASDVINELTLAEAAAWLTRLQESGRTQAIEAAFKEWLAASPAHARAFTRVNDVWELIPGAIKPAHRPREVRNARTRAGRRTRRFVAAGCVALLLLLAVVSVVRFLPADRTYQTAIGAQQTVMLDDNTRVTLNTDTRLTVEYRANERRILLERGEALFEVAKNPQRPFVVQTGDEQVVALGTTFDVRRDPTRLEVVLLEGKVEIGKHGALPDATARKTVLKPGERFIMVAGNEPVLDRPEIAGALAWQHGQVYFDDTALSDAVAELNRYGNTRIRFADPAIASLRVSGVFSTRDPAQFAAAVASLHGLRLAHKDASLELTR